MGNTTFEYERSPFYYETDKMGIVHHSNYIRWFEEVRVAYMADRGYPYSRMESEGVMIPVLGVDCKYKIPVKFGEPVIIKGGIELFDGLRLNVAYEIYDKETGKLHVTGRTEHCFVSAGSFRPLRLNKTHPEMAEIFM
ncbi:MAG: acyl-CoA thioesterase [Ruminiclostridium sp.]|nr:acyl-CoA thioesterase [Ruminiclostridium sp.]